MKELQDLDPMPQFYVYALIDPRGGSTFYIGKGSGPRAWRTVSAVRCKRGIENRKLQHKIASIFRAELKPAVQIIERFHQESDAFRFERSEIKRLGRQNLCNLTDGGEGSSGARNHVIPHSQQTKELIRIGGSRCFISRSCRKGFAHMGFHWKRPQ